MSAITKIFGTHSERELKRIYPLVDKVESYREAMGALSDEELKNKTKEYKRDWRTARRWTIFFRRHMRRCVRRRSVCSAWSIIVCRLLVVSFSTRDVSLR